MNSRWSDQAAANFDDDLAMRLYTSRLLGAEEALVMHGGGNTSVKSEIQDFYGRRVDVLFVKGSGWDLATIEREGFSALRLNETKMLAQRDTLSDSEMAKQLRANLIDPTAPSPSVEAILHAILPLKFVDHTHSDSVVTLSNNPNGDALIQTLYPDCLLLPYIMPGFALAKQVFKAIQDVAIEQYKGIILHHHGVLTFSQDAKTAYENMIELVDRADRYIASHADPKISPASPPSDLRADLSADLNSDLLSLARIRRTVSEQRGIPQLVSLNSTPAAQAFAARDDVDRTTARGPITPDHVIYTKRTALVVEQNVEDDIPEVRRFAEDYQTYFTEHDDGGLTMLDVAPRWAVWKNVGTIAFGTTIKECQIIGDITRHTVWAIQTGESLGGWQALPASDIFQLEYWSLEQAKLKKHPGAAKPHRGKIAVVTGAASGIGRATAEQLHRDGAVVVGLDIVPAVAERLSQTGLTGRVCDVTDEDAVQKAIEAIVGLYGGLDIVVLNAGVFNSGETIDELAENWDRTLEVNLTATQRFLKQAIPYLKLGIDSSAIMIGSRNYSAPGAGAAAYSVSKAGVTQLARVAALELAKDGVRVNVIHPDAVFDTELWTQEALERSAKRYHISVQEYKTKNLLGREIRSADVARLVSTVASDTFGATTGAQIPIDGGSDRVI